MSVSSNHPHTKQASLAVRSSVALEALRQPDHLLVLLRGPTCSLTTPACSPDIHKAGGSARGAEAFRRSK